MLSFPCACPIANRALHAALLEDPPGQATVPTDECYVVRAETLDGAEVVSTVADIDNALVLAVGMALPKCIKLITLAHVRTASYFARMLWPIWRNASPQTQQSIGLPVRRIRDNFCKERWLGEALAWQNRMNIYFIRVGKKEKVGAMVMGLQRAHAADHGGVHRHGP